MFSFDLKEFYYNVDCSIILNQENLHFDNNENRSKYFGPIMYKLNKLMFDTINKWCIRNYDSNKGLPIGLGSSKIIANMALTELDTLLRVSNQIAHFGRYS